MQGIWTVLLLIVSNFFMTLAWYGNLKLEEMNINKGWPLRVSICTGTILYRSVFSSWLCTSCSRNKVFLHTRCLSCNLREM
jgi:uncharacterized protein (DUF486 family)